VIYAAAPVYSSVEFGTDEPNRSVGYLRSLAVGDFGSCPGVGKLPIEAFGELPERLGSTAQFSILLL
jgi:hypothetical protein